MNDADHDQFDKRLCSRRSILKVVAGAPLAITFAMLASPLMRFLKPTMKPGQFFQSADFPVAEQPAQFSSRDFPEIWTCLPFMVSMKYAEFNAEKVERRKIPGYIIRTDKNQFVAYSRICPNRRDHILYYVADSSSHCCGCVHDKGNCGCVPAKSKTPILFCPHDRSVFGLSDDGSVLAGPSFRPPRKFTIDHQENFLTIKGLEQPAIA